MTFERKEKIVKKLNERMRKSIKKLGKHIKEYNYWQVRIDALKSIKGTQMWSEELGSYTMISRKKSDIEAMSDDELRDLEKTTRTWEEVQSGYIRAYNEENPDKPITPGDVKDDHLGVLDKLSEFTNIVRRIQDLFEEHTDIFYLMLAETEWDDVKDHSSEEILQELLKVLGDKYANGQEYVMTEEEHERIRDEYFTRRSKAQKIREEAGL